MPDRSDLRKKGRVDFVPCGGEGHKSVREKAGHNVSTGRDEGECRHHAYFLLSLRLRVPPTSGLGLLSSVKLL